MVTQYNARTCDGDEIKGVDARKNSKKVMDNGKSIPRNDCGRERNSKSRR